MRILDMVARYKPGIELEPGEHLLEISAGGYRTHKGSYAVEAGDATLRIVLEALARMARIARGGFRMTETEVTRGEFAAFVEATGYRTDAETKTGGKQGCFTYQGGVDFGWNEEASWRAPAPTSAA